MSENKVLAIVAGEEITDGMLDALLAQAPANQQRYMNNPQVRQQYLDQLISMRLFTQLGLEMKIDETEEFKEILESAKKDIFCQLAMTKVLGSVTVSDDEALSYFEVNGAKFGTAPTVSAKHILVDTLELAKEAAEKIASGEMSFEKAATFYSTCPSKDRGGDLGAFGKGQMVREFEEAAFAAEIDVVTEPVKTQFGYHLIKVYDKKEGEIPAFEEVKESVKREMIQKKQDTIYRQQIAELSAKYYKEV